MLFDLETARVPEGTVLLIGAQYRNSETGQLYPKIWTYAALKAGGRWYLTGTGKVPQDAGWGAVKRWLASHGREVVWIKMATELETLYAADPAVEQVSDQRLQDLGVPDLPDMGVYERW